MRSPRQLLQDIVDACQVVIDSTPAIEAQFDGDPHLRSHIYLHILIVGEACARMPPTIKDAHPMVPCRPSREDRPYLTAADHRAGPPADAWVDPPAAGAGRADRGAGWGRVDRGHRVAGLSRAGRGRG